MGDYLVLAQNQHGEDMTSCHLSLNMSPNVDSDSIMISSEMFKDEEENELVTKKPDLNKRLIPPRVLIPLSNVKIEEGSPMRLACKIDGLPKPKVLDDIIKMGIGVKLYN